MSIVLEHHRSELLARMRAATDAARLFEDVSARLRRLVPFDASLWFATDPATTLATAPARVQGLGEDDPESCAAYWNAEFLVEDVNLYRDVARAPTPVATLWNATAGHPARSSRYRELLKPLGLQDEMRAAMRVGTSPWGMITLMREAGREPFSEAEIALVASLSAPMAQALRSCALAERTVEPGGPDAPGMVLFDERNHVLSFNDAARDWIEQLPAGPRYPSLGVCVTTEMLATVGQARMVADGRGEGTARLRVRARTGRWLVLHASCLAGADGARGATALVIEPAQASEIAPIIVEAHALSPREQEITELVARGVATAEIAGTLHLSVHTVRDHLKAVFEKVGVSSRGELVAKLFAEHYAAPLRRRTVHV
ncbi:MAG TPA: helix-turn-helix transcriptional regulator [Solirubrobacteraceae bacterium]|nr:helix-turn-helix transcriptional regulator [Solirubrobacteraceae bacterium]